jgi:ABC-type nitrate/sulfonate/bicarbonate transport system ATPase subunit
VLTDTALPQMDEPFSAIDAINRMALQDHLVNTWLTERRTVFYVTHDIEEAVYLADHIVILKFSPGRLAADLRNALPHPHNRNSIEFITTKSQVTEEMQRHGLTPE